MILPLTFLGAGRRIVRFVRFAPPTVKVTGAETEVAVNANAVWVPGNTLENSNEPSESTTAVSGSAPAAPLIATLITRVPVALSAMTRPLTWTDGGVESTP